MNPGLILDAALKLVPLVLTAARAHRNATGEEPTDEQVIAALHFNVAQRKAFAERWLAEHPEEKK